MGRFAQSVGGPRGHLPDVVPAIPTLGEGAEGKDKAGEGPSLVRDLFECFFPCLGSSRKKKNRKRRGRPVRRNPPANRYRLRHI